MKRHRFVRRKQPEESDDWLTTYADAITLLLAFFVMLVNFSKIDIPRFEAVQAGIAERIGKRETVRPIEVLEQDITDIVVFNIAQDSAVSVSTDDEGILMDMASGAFFEPGSARFAQQAVIFLLEIADLLQKPRYLGMQIEVIGHTDDTPIGTPRFPSNWDLAAGRAISLVRFFESRGVSSARMRAVSHGQAAPKLPNRDNAGNPIPGNMEANRRVVVRVFPKYSRPIAGG